MEAEIKITVKDLENLLYDFYDEIMKYKETDRWELIKDFIYHKLRYND